MDMFDMGSLLAALNGMKAAKDLAVAALEARDASRMSAAETQLNSQIINAQQGVLDLQASMLQMLSENQRLQEELRKLKATQDQRVKYRLVSLRAGQFAYQLSQAPPPKHYICQKCLDVRQIEVVLDRHNERSLPYVEYRCHECKAHVTSDEAR